MNDIVSFLALAGLCVLALSTIGWFACPRQERLPARQLGFTDWVAVLRTGVRLVATWGPRFPYANRRTAGPAPQPQPQQPTEHTAG